MKNSNVKHILSLPAIALALAGCPSDDITETQETGDGTETTSPTSSSGTTLPTTSTMGGSETSETSLDTTDTTAEGTTGTTGGTDTDKGSTDTGSTDTGGTEAGSTDTGGSSDTGVTETTAGESVCGDGMTTGNEECDDANDDATDGCLPNCQIARSCAHILQEVPDADDGAYTITPDNGSSFAVSCDMTTDGGGWTLVARFANADNVDHWMLDDGGWWFDLETEQGNPLSTGQLTDMLSQAFWRMPGQEFKVARSDNPDPSHLLMTNDNCLDGDTFRGFITSLGFENIGLPWSTDEVLHTCTVDLGNNYAATQGFPQAHCSGDIGAPESISFWANWHDPNNPVAADSSVMMIGGGGQACARADHGIGITEENDASFNVFNEPEGVFEHDFGNDGFAAPAMDYALNLYVR